MKELIGVLLASALLIGGTALAVTQFDDRALFVPPPDAVAEQFVRSVVTKRFDQAQACLAKPVSTDELRELQKTIEQRTGDPWEIEAETVTRGDRSALVHVQISSGKGSEALSFALQFDTGWKVILKEP